MAEDVLSSSSDLGHSGYTAKELQDKKQKIRLEYVKKRNPVLEALNGLFNAGHCGAFLHKIILHGEHHVQGDPKSAYGRGTPENIYKTPLQRKNRRGRQARPGMAMPSETWQSLHRSVMHHLRRIELRYVPREGAAEFDRMRSLSPLTTFASYSILQAKGMFVLLPTISAGSFAEKILDHWPYSRKPKKMTVVKKASDQKATARKKSGPAIDPPKDNMTTHLMTATWFDTWMAYANQHFHDTSAIDVLELDGSTTHNASIKFA
ncbi:hypothetical protein BU24DRAFT_409751 [Aaosphaeria arxii CBS 175.79]|uniref:Uncharacterized protein n=1 Tax=Aaosphaeria arxii CBS 175.79 TaxID=1450172 RepID=A0A6A5XVL3_9PLEO|nr:uncharacterized protein BU24DRAFT_409751 [Aaosphaeria arxii CBS 175.79]KAF2016670.1 hypothetical protein BU24DRAFT_409751 [Aaosphaeria arxii CBS 175.79]